MKLLSEELLAGERETLWLHRGYQRAIKMSSRRQELGEEKLIVVAHKNHKEFFFFLLLTFLVSLSFSLFSGSGLRWLWWAGRTRINYRRRRRLLCSMWPNEIPGFCTQALTETRRNQIIKFALDSLSREKASVFLSQTREGSFKVRKNVV